MALGEPIKIRLSLEKHLAYEEDAQRQGKPLAAYIRERLEAEDAIQNELAALRNKVEYIVGGVRHEIASLWRKIEDAAANNGAESRDQTGQGSLIELLLMLRANTAPDKMMMIHAELRRLGLEPWTHNSKGKERR